VGEQQARTNGRAALIQKLLLNHCFSYKDNLPRVSLSASIYQPKDSLKRWRAHRFWSEFRFQNHQPIAISSQRFGDQTDSKSALSGDIYHCPHKVPLQLSSININMAVRRGKDRPLYLHCYPVFTHIKEVTDESMLFPRNNDLALWSFWWLKVMIIQYVP